jgi:hypothetical protein
LVRDADGRVRWRRTGVSATAPGTGPTDSRPPLASLVLSGDTQTEAVAITGYIFMAKDRGRRSAFGLR